MNGFRILAVLCLVLLMTSGVSALKMVSGGSTTVISEPIDDDVLASGGTLVVNAPVGSLIAAGGEVQVNAPVAGDVIAAGGNVWVNGTVGGKVVLAGGQVALNGTVARNAIATGGRVTFGPGARIGRDAEVSGGTFVHQGAVNGTLGVNVGTFMNSGTAGAIRYDTSDNRSVNRTAPGPGPFTGLGALIAGIVAILSLLVTIGYLILGLLLLAVAPGVARAVETRVHDQPIPAFAIGLAALIGAVILGLILLVTVVGIPIAVLGWLFIIAGVMLAGLVVSLALGRLIAGKTGIGQNIYVLFIIGFVVLNVLYLIPILGDIIKFVVVCLGFGAIVMAVMDAVSGRRTAL
ncbi:MAG: hypothetical protein ABFC89_03435 [Methanospirillum sp.]